MTRWAISTGPPIACAASSIPPTSGMETRPQVEAVLDDGRRINQAVARGNYGSEVARLWAALRNNINDLARAYGLTPLGV